MENMTMAQVFIRPVHEKEKNGHCGLQRKNQNWWKEGDVFPRVFIGEGCHQLCCNSMPKKSAMGQNEHGVLSCQKGRKKVTTHLWRKSVFVTEFQKKNQRDGQVAGSNGKGARGKQTVIHTVPCCNQKATMQPQLKDTFCDARKVESHRSICKCKLKKQLHGDTDWKDCFEFRAIFQGQRNRQVLHREKI